jgi:hypothetical protein
MAAASLNRSGDTMLLQHVRLAATVAVTAGLALAAAAPGHAQVVPREDFTNARYYTLGYVVNAPRVLIGGGATLLNPTGIGFFANVKLSSDSPGGRSNFMPDVTVDQAFNEFGDFQFRDESSWLVFSGGVTRVLSPELAVYAGAGLARREYYREFEDPSGGRGEFGYYWVEDTEFSGDFVNVLGGLFFRAGRNLIMQFGAESQPRGMTIGVHYGLPTRR